MQNYLSMLRKAVARSRAFACICVVGLSVSTARATQYFGPDTYRDFDIMGHADFLRVTRHGVTLPVPDLHWTVTVGQRVQLFQETDDCYVAVRVSDAMGVQLCAFPTKTAGAGTAWVTNEGRLIFGRETRTCEGKLYLHRSERLPIVDSSGDTYGVLVERYNTRILLDVPKGLSGTEVEHREVRPVAAPRPPPQNVRVTMGQGTAPAAQSVTPTPVRTPPQTEHTVPVVAPRPVAVSDDHGTADRTEDRPRPAPPAGTTREAARQISEQELIARVKQSILEEMLAEGRRPPRPEKPAVVAPVTNTPPAGSTEVHAETPPPPPVIDVPPPVHVATAAVAHVAGQPVAAPLPPETASMPTTALMAQVSEEAREPGRATGVVSEAAEAKLPVQAVRSVEATKPRTGVDSGGGAVQFLSHNALRFQILLAVCIIEGLLIIKYQRDSRRSMMVDNSVLAFTTADESVPRTSTVESLVHRSELSGSLEQFPVHHVIQLLYSTEESGVLVVTCPGDSQAHRIYVRDGQIIDAVHGTARGIEVIRDLFNSPAGVFSFRRGDMADREPHFVEDTMSLLLETARLADESA